MLDNYEVPHIYCIPNLHNTPIKFRLITGARNSSIKPIKPKNIKSYSTISERISKDMLIQSKQEIDILLDIGL